jgi:hypothetical protein
MATVTKTWVFAADNEGLADQAKSTTITAAWLSSDGSPANGCLRFTAVAKSINGHEIASKGTTTDTWETWGVPAGATVTAIELTNWKSRVAAFTNGTSHNFDLHVVDSGSNNVVAPYLIGGFTLPTTVNSSWVTQSTSGPQSVDPLFSASTQTTMLEIDYHLITPSGGATPSIDFRLDSLELTITYTPASTDPVFPDLSVSMSQPRTSGSVQATTGQNPPTPNLTVSDLSFFNSSVMMSVP